MNIQSLLMDNLGSITSVFLGISALAYAWSAARNVLTQVNELLAVIIGSMQDNSLTSEEAGRIIKEGGDVVGAVKQALANSKTK